VKKKLALLMIQNMDFKRMFVKNNSQTGKQPAVDAMIKAIVYDKQFAQVMNCFFVAPAPAPPVRR
jgi:hypothetical protein